MNSISEETLQHLANAHAAALIVLTNVQVPLLADSYHNDAISILKQTFDNIKEQYLTLTGKVLNIEHVKAAFQVQEQEEEEANEVI